MQANYFGCQIKDKLNGPDFQKVLEHGKPGHVKTSWFRFPKPTFISENYIPDLYKPLVIRTEETFTVIQILMTQSESV